MGNRGTDDAGTPERVWREQENETMNITVGAEDLARLARSREKLNRAVLWVTATVVCGLAGRLLYNVYTLERPWIRVGQAWTLGIVALFAAGLNRGAGRVAAGETCASFLERQHEERARGYRRIRMWLPLVTPGIAASWMGGAKTWAVVVTGAALVLVWVLFGEAAKKAYRDRDEVRRRAAIAIE